MNKLSRISALFFCMSATSFIYGQKAQSVAINFQGVVGDKAFSCNETYGGIGTTKSSMTVSDFRFFVENVRLVDKKGKETPLTLTNDGKFQTDKVALIDFENGEGACKNGTPELNTTIRGAVPKGKYVGVRFQIGVPEELNHLDPTKQPSPLNITRMMWSWQAGFKFARIDTKTTGKPNGYVLHLGSAGCKADTDGKITCTNSNRPEFAFAKFDAAKDVINVDLAALYKESNVDINQEKTASGCMSSPDDSDCKAVFLHLGLSFDGVTPAKQSFMRLENASKTTARKSAIVANTLVGVK
ncbi:MAG: metallo-mystery pair system four-Cys motif protein [Chloracidobacterium sp.]|nr:metallo-mystery pair system four-Cys motif protein [Chloracidobacterium sp.]